MLDEKEVNSILWDYINNVCKENGNIQLNNFNMNHYVTEICKLKPKNQKVIVELRKENKLLKSILKPFIDNASDGWFMWSKALTKEEIELIYKLMRLDKKINTQNS